jgi:hypothetical protein
MYSCMCVCVCMCLSLPLCADAFVVVAGGQAIDTFARQALRTLVLAFRQLEVCVSTHERGACPSARRGVCSYVARQGGRTCFDGGGGGWGRSTWQRPAVDAFMTAYKEADSAIGDRAERVARACAQIEHGFSLLGVSAVEDKLQARHAPCRAAYAACGPGPV